MADQHVRILLIEDNPIHARLVQPLLAQNRQPACEVEAVDRLSAGLARLEKGGVDLVSPDSHELETFVQVRAAAPEIPIVILTGLDDVKLTAKAVEAGTQDYLVKSQFSSVSLQRSIRYTLKRTLAHSAEWDAPMFRLAQQQFLKAAQIMDLDDNIRQRLLFPQRTQVVSFPFRRALRDQLDMRTAASIEGIKRVTQAKLLRGVFP